jgi:hypothetical protein
VDDVRAEPAPQAGERLSGDALLAHLVRQMQPGWRLTHRATAEPASRGSQPPWLIECPVRRDRPAGRLAILGVGDTPEAALHAAVVNWLAGPPYDEATNRARRA